MNNRVVHVRVRAHMCACVSGRIIREVKLSRRCQARHARLPVSLALRLRPGAHPCLMLILRVSVNAPCGCSVSQLCSCSSSAQVRTHTALLSLWTLHGIKRDKTYKPLFVCFLEEKMRSDLFIFFRWTGRRSAHSLERTNADASLKLSMFLILAHNYYYGNLLIWMNLH